MCTSTMEMWVSFTNGLYEHVFKLDETIGNLFFFSKADFFQTIVTI